METKNRKPVDKPALKRSNRNDTFRHIETCKERTEPMQDRTQNKLRRQLAGMLCGLLLLSGCGGSGPQPPAEPPVIAEQPAAPQPDPPKDPPKEPEPPAESPAESPAEPDPEPEEAPALEYCILDYTSVSVRWAGEAGTLVVVKTQARNPGEKPFTVDNTVQALGGITTANAADGMNADGIAAGKVSEQLTARVRTDRNEKCTRPVTAAVDGATAEIEAGQSAVVELYLFLPEQEGSWTRIDLLDGDVQLGYLTPRPAKKNAAKTQHRLAASR